MPLRSVLKPGTSPEFLGLTDKRMAKLRAAVELGKRLYCTSPHQGEVLDNPDKAAQVLQAAIGYEPVEKFAVLILDIKNRLIAREIISSGTVNESFACPRDIFRAVILGNGCRCIVAHNHPSGIVTASPEDLIVTRRILQASEHMGLPVLDHLIVSHGQFYSIRRESSLWSEIPQAES